MKRLLLALALCAARDRPGAVQDVLLWDVDQATADQYLVADNRFSELSKSDPDRRLQAAAGLTEPRCASERGLAMRGGRPAERRFTVGRQRQIRGSVPSRGARVLEVRIHLPPAESPQNFRSLARRARSSRWSSIPTPQAPPQPGSMEWSEWQKRKAERLARRDVDA